MDKFLEQAELILENKLNFIHPCDMERCETVYSIPNSWNETPNGDDEWIYMRARLGYFDGLILKYTLTKDIKYVEKIKEIISNFITHHKILKYEKSTRTLDSGIRIVNILRVLIFFEKHKIDYDNLIVEHLSKTCDYLFDSYISKYDGSNWGFIQMAGVYSYALYFDDVKKKKESFKFLKKQLEMQILDDGLHWEKSQTYHYQIVIYLMFIIYISKIKNETCNIKFFLKYLKKTTISIENLHYPDNTQINFGDSDDNEIESILSLAKYLLNEESVYKITNISKMFIPDAVVKTKEKTKERKVASFLKSGYIHVFDDKFSFSTYSTPMSSSHTHIDYLHFNYYYNKKIFVDNGRYTYTDSDIRNYLKSAYAHNSIIIDDTPASKILGSWDYDNYQDVLPIDVINEKEGLILKLAIYDNVNNALIQRHFINIEENVLIINKIKCRGKHSIKMLYNLYPNTKIEKLKNHILLNDEIAFRVSEYSVTDGIYSPMYNKICKSKKIVVEKTFVDEYVEVNAILNKSVTFEDLQVYQGENKVLDNRAKAYRLKTEKGSYIIFIKPNEIYEGQKVFHVQGKPFYENVKIIKE